MNIALSSLILILLLAPGLLFRTFLIKSDSLENPLDTSVKTELGIVLFLTIVLHLPGYLVVTTLFHSEFDFGQFYLFLTGSKDFSIELIRSSWYLFLLYILCMMVSGALLGYGFKQIILRYYLDLTFKFLPISNEWDNLLSGRLYHFDRLQHLKEKRRKLRVTRKEFLRKTSGHPDAHAAAILQKIDSQLQLIETKMQQRVDFVMVDALTESRTVSMIYKGKLFRYYLSKNNSLDKIVLKNPFRRKFLDRSESISRFNPPEFYEFESKLFVLNYTEIKNLNVRVVYFEPVETIN